jgi:hypothetical protein
MSNGYVHGYDVSGPALLERYEGRYRRDHRVLRCSRHSQWSFAEGKIASGQHLAADQDGLDSFYIALLKG